MLRFLAIALQLGLILVVVHLFRIEQDRFFLEMLGLCTGGFLIHTWLPDRFRLPFFCLLSLFSIVLFLGWMPAAFVLGIGAGLIALCQLRVRLLFQVLLTLVAGLILFIWRVESDAGFWVIVGAMFMFRIIVFLYECGQAERPPLVQTVAYFFCLPSVCFTLLPVIDFKTFRDTYYDDEPFVIYHTGVVWIVRGLTHLLAYRFIKYFVLPAPHEIVDFPHFMLFLAANYALYLRVSGWFHIITGSCTCWLQLARMTITFWRHVSDIWRRISIYWKDFMTNVFFFPAFYAYAGSVLYILVGSLFVFGNLALALYQIFSGRPCRSDGATPRCGRRRGRGFDAPCGTFGDVPPCHRTRKCADSAAFGMSLMAKDHSTFVLVSHSGRDGHCPARRTSVLADSGAFGGKDVLFILVGILVIMAVGAIIGFASAAPNVQRLVSNIPLVTRYAVPVMLLALIAFGIPQVGDVLGPDASDVLATMRLETTEPVEALVTVQGYYEQIADVPLPSSPLAVLPWRPKPAPPLVNYAEFSRPVDDWLERELIPGWTGTVADKQFTVNDLGMRDRHDRTEKSRRACCIAAVGSSIVMGWGAATMDVLPFT